MHRLHFARHRRPSDGTVALVLLKVPVLLLPLPPLPLLLPLLLLLVLPLLEVAGLQPKSRHGVANRCTPLPCRRWSASCSSAHTPSSAPSTTSSTKSCTTTTAT
jgi:hypothetical protein